MAPLRHIAACLRGFISAVLCAGALCGVAVPGSAKADSVSDFYAGKTLSLLAGFPPGGGYDVYVRVLARHYGRFIPGHPAVVPSNMPGARSIHF